MMEGRLPLSALMLTQREIGWHKMAYSPDLGRNTINAMADSPRVVEVDGSGDGYVIADI